MTLNQARHWLMMTTSTCPSIVHIASLQACLISGQMNLYQARHRVTMITSTPIDCQYRKPTRMVQQHQQKKRTPLFGHQRSLLPCPCEPVRCSRRTRKRLAKTDIQGLPHVLLRDMSLVPAGLQRKLSISMHSMRALV